ncbi:GNAT family N-acetyltransferase [Streptomyces sp. NBC_01411]|uniref:GNAT family N-acetyltransferase n=1 Tax=Streptomyces sp. NBC_01411 TaxID=2903857 RepID=UPI00325178A1
MPFSTPISSTTVVLAEHPSDALDELAPLWGELLAHHVASAPHLSALGQVRTAAESWQIRREEYRAWLEEPHTKILTVTGHGQLLGYAFVRITPAAGSWKLGDRVGVLETLVVAAEARGGGLGRRLVEAVADHCKAHGAATMRISVIEGNDAHGFYARYGAVGFTNTLLLPLPEQCIQPSVGHSIPAQAAAVRWTVVEHVTVAKGAAPNEDRLLIADNGWLAVIDGATDKSGRSYGGMTGGARAAGRVAVTLSSLPADTAPPDAVTRVTQGLADLRAKWDIPTDDPVAPSAVAAVHAPELDQVWRVGDVHIALRTGDTWTHHPAAKAIDDVLAGTRAAYLHCLLAAGHSANELAGADPGRALILPVLEQQGRLANRTCPYGYGVLDGTNVPTRYIEVFPLAGVEEVVIASDGYLSAAPTLEAAEDALALSLAEDPLRMTTNSGTKGVKPGAQSFDDRTYIRLLRPTGAERLATVEA